VQHDGWALRFAADELRADRGIVLAAVRQKSSALQYASAELQLDPEIRSNLSAVETDPGLLYRFECDGIL
jgi:hypothetical protein